ncbi:uncharacterized [Tachysurus ichikawai]
MVTGCQTHIRVLRSCLLEVSSSSCASEVAGEKKAETQPLTVCEQWGIVGLRVIGSVTPADKAADQCVFAPTLLPCYPAMLLRNRVHMDVRGSFTEIRPPVPAARRRTQRDS